MSYLCNYCGYRESDCKGGTSKKRPKCRLVNATLSFEGDHGVWRTPSGAVAMKYVLADKKKKSS